jgi:4-hydroxy-2-oxoheptanedioate aldolase
MPTRASRRRNVRQNLVRAACYAGSVSVGAFVSITDPVSAQIFARSGYEWLVIDMEHGPVPMAALSSLVNAIRTTQTEPFVRAAWNTSAAIQVALDHGASGVMVPMVSTLEDALRAVADVRYSPLGARSRGGVRIALSFETDGPTYFREANDEVLLMAQIETAQAIENIDAIAAVEGLDSLFVGPNDLAASYGLEYPAAWKDQTGPYAAAIDAVPAAAARHGKIAGILANSPAMANECIARGYVLVGCGSDTTTLWEAARRQRAEIYGKR